MVVCFRLWNYDTGLYPLQALSSLEEMPLTLQNRPPPTVALSESNLAAMSDAIERADAFVASTDALPREVRDALGDKFTRAQTHGSLTVYLRRGRGLTSLE
jgi:hypothetical protein